MTASLDAIPQRPVAAAETPGQQRLEVELLLGEAVLSSEEVLSAGPERWGWNSSLTKEISAQKGCVPVAYSTEGLVVAVPTHWGIDERSEVSSIDNEGRPVELRLALQNDIQAAIEQIEGDEPAQADEIATPKPQEAPSAESQIKRFKFAGASTEVVPEENFSDIDVEKSLQASNASPVIRLVDRILIQALERNASDIHIEPQEGGLLIRMRQDGVLEELDMLPKPLIPAVTSRFKILADLDISERRLPQDGRIRRRYQNKIFDLRVSSLPSRFGEKICMRLLDSSATKLGLDKLVSNPKALADIREMGRKPFGMLLVTGPTGSGKSTTLYSLLAERNEPTINISTVEDPIEYTLKGITQTQVNREKGYDFSMALRAFMRQDPDVLLVGETRDQETAKTAIEAALTGHLVLTTLHCNDAPSAIARLAEMGVEPFMVSASLIGIVSQRLVRRVCPQCREPYQPSEQELGRFGLFASKEQSLRFYKAKRIQASDTEHCPMCQGLGYKGRVGIYEVLRVNETIASAIAQDATTDKLRKLAIETGMKTLLGYGLDLVRQGETTLDEIERMILTDSSLETERRAKALNTISCRGCGAGLRDEWLECPYCMTERDLG